MLISSVMRTIVQISAASGPLMGADPISSGPNGAPIAPGEPSTLTLSLIGAGLIAAYFAIGWRPRVQRDSQQMAPPIGNQQVADVEGSTRDAA